MTSVPKAEHLLKRLRVGAVATLGVAALIATTPGLADLVSVAATTTVDGPIVTEIQGDNTGYDNFEYIELTNPTDTAIDFAADGITLGYDLGSSVKQLATADMANTGTTPNIVLQPGQTTVLWLSYNDKKNVDSFAKTEQQFRDAVGLTDTAVPVVRITGQAGIANGGKRGIVVQRGGETLSESYLPTISPEAPGLSTHFALPVDPVSKQLSVWQQSTAGTPGVVDAAQLVDAGSSDGDGDGDGDDNGGDNGSEDGGDNGEQPETDATPGFDPVADPNAQGPALQITEVLPDSSNVGGSDGYEFIEVYNSSSEPVNFADYVLTYLIPIDYDTNTTETLWPSTKRDVTIAPASTLVLWVKNSANQALTAADFNTKFGTSLVADQNLLEIQSAGMANGSMRGLALRTNTGETINRAYYNMSIGQGIKDPVADQGLQYTRGTDSIRPDVQRILDNSAATPGQVSQDQVGTSLVVPAADTAQPTIENTTPASTDGSTDLTLSAHITDNVQVRTVELTYRNNVDNTDQTVQLKREDGDVFSATIAAGDLTGKSSIDYTFAATDGTTERAQVSGTVAIDRGVTGPVSLNVNDGQVVSGTVPLVASGDAGNPTITIDGQTQQTTPSLPSEPTFLFETTNTDVFFRNGVKVENADGQNDVLKIFDEGTYSNVETISTPVPLSYIAPGQPLKMSIWAGTKAWPDIDLNENNDDFMVQNLRLVLPDGRTLRAPEWSDPDEVIQMGDSTGKHDYIDATFSIDDAAFSGSGFSWDTTQVADGRHTVTGRSGGDELQADVIVDNTAPQVTPTVTSQNDTEQGMHGAIILDAAIDDGAGDVAGVPASGVTAKLDGSPVTLPYQTSTVDLTPGQHTFTVTAVDAAGNRAEETTTFSTVDETPSEAELAVGQQATLNADGTATVDLSATSTDPTGDDLTVTFNEGTAQQLGTDVQVSSGQTADALAVDRSSAVALSEDDLAKLGSTDGVGATSAGTDGLPYQLFTVAVPQGVTTGQVRAVWSGTSNPNAQVTLYAKKADGSGWDQIDRHYTPADDEGANFTLSGYVGVESHAVDGQIALIVQHSDGWSGADLTTRDSTVDTYNADATDRSDYDFTLAWESDTQYYNEDLSDNYKYQTDIHQFLLDQRENLNLKYLFHTGDIVDDFDQEYEWRNADNAYKMLEQDADGNPLPYADRLPYGVLAGNHDVGHKSDSYTNFSNWFGADRFAGSPWLGGDYEDNRGHYDLFSAGGIDFMTVSMGWDPGTDEIAWMNKVIAEHPERTVIINLHEYMLTTGGLGPIPQRIMDEVVATNPNVSMVFSGHYHDAYTRQDQFDDNGDGVNDRTVTSMLFDYQGLEQGGLGYLRLLHFDNQSQQMQVRTYSPSLDDFDSDEASLAGADGQLQYQEFAVSYSDLGVKPQTKTLTTDSFSASVLQNRSESAAFSPATGLSGVLPASGLVSGGLLTAARAATVQANGAIASVAVASGETATAQWTVPGPGVYGVYAEAVDPYSTTSVSPVLTFTVRTDGSVTQGAVDPNVSGTDDGAGDGSGSGSDSGLGSADSGSGSVSGSDNASTRGQGASGGALATTGGDAWLLVLGLSVLALGAVVRMFAHRRLR